MKKKDPALAKKAESTGMNTFFKFTIIQIIIGVWFLISIPKETMMLFMGKNMISSAIFILALIITAIMLYLGYKKKTYARSKD